MQGDGYIFSSALMLLQNAGGQLFQKNSETFAIGSGENK
jgi:hypothetical protein